MLSYQRLSFVKMNTITNLARILSDFIKGGNVVKSTFLPFLILRKLDKTIKKEGQFAPFLPPFLVW